MIIKTEKGNREIRTMYDHIINSMDVTGMDSLEINLRVDCIDDSLLTQELWADLLKLYRSLLWAKRCGFIQDPKLEQIVDYKQLRS